MRADGLAAPLARVWAARTARTPSAAAVIARAAAAAVIAVGASAAGACSEAAPSPSAPATSPGVRSPAVTGPPVTSAGWRRLASAPTARTEVAATAAGDRIYVMGGYRDGGSTVPTVEIYHPATDSWQRGPDLPVPVNHAMATTAGQTVYLFGGYRADGTPSAEVFRLDASGWRAMARMPEARAAGAAVALADRVYVVGGVGADRGLAENTLSYDVAADRWSSAPGLPTPREHLGGAGFDGLVYAVAGRRGGIGGILPTVESYDPLTRRWTRLPDLPTPRGGLAAAAVCSGHVIAVGGEADATFAEVEAYDIRAGTWRRLPALPTPRHGLGVVAMDATLYVLAGGPRPGLHVSAVTEAIDLATLGAGC